MSKRRSASQVKPREFKPADVVKAEELGIEYQLWKPGVHSFKCPSPVCQFDSVDLDILLDHITKEHTVKPPTKESPIIYADKYGTVQPGPPGSGGTK
jgi:hypothetical protein